MLTETVETETRLANEPQLNITYNQKPSLETVSENNVEELRVLSLFSGCGGMDLGFEGGFSVLQESINEVLTPHFIEKKF